MKTLLLMVALLAVAAPSVAQERLADQLRKGIVEEEANQNLDKAIQAYQSIVARYDEDRKAAAAAMFRLAECYRKAGKREQAIAAYQRVTREFADQPSIVEPSRRQLVAFGVPDAREAAPVRAVETRRQFAEQSHNESPREPKLKDAPPMPTDTAEETRLALQAAENELVRVQRLVEQGLVGSDDVRAVQLRLEDLRLKYQRQRAEEQGARALNERMILSVQEEIKLVQGRITEVEAKVKTGQASPNDAELVQLRRDLLGLQRKLDELRLNLRR